MWFFKKRKAKKKAKELEKIEAEQKAKEAEKENEVADEAKVTQEKSVKVASKTETKATPKAEKVEEVVKEDSKATAAKYHVSQNNDTKSQYHKQWRVRKGGSKKTIKYFKTQAEAIDYAEHLAEQAGSSIVIHKMDGKIRKQDYSK